MINSIEIDSVMTGARRLHLSSNSNNHNNSARSTVLHLAVVHHHKILIDRLRCIRPRGRKWTVICHHRHNKWVQVVMILAGTTTTMEIEEARLRLPAMVPPSATSNASVDLVLGPGRGLIVGACHRRFATTVVHLHHLVEDLWIDRIVER